MPEIENISWRELTGNKFSKNLEPAMISEHGHIKQQRIRRTGDAQQSIFYVTYDYEYLIGYLAKVICKNLFTLGKERILQLVEEAWDTYYGKQPVNPRIKYEVK